MIGEAYYSRNTHKHRTPTATPLPTPNDEPPSTPNQGRPQKLFVRDAQKASARLIASFVPPGTQRAGGSSLVWSTELAEGEMAFEEIETGTVLASGTVVAMTRNAAWLDLGVRRRGSRGRLYKVNGDLTRHSDTDTPHS